MYAHLWYDYILPLLLLLFIVDGGLKYKVNFGSKKMLLSGHHVAFPTPPILAQLKVGARVAARFHEGNQTWVMSAVIMELPDRKNRMRWRNQMSAYLSMHNCSAL